MADFSGSWGRPKIHNTFTCANSHHLMSSRTVKWMSQMSYARELYENVEFSTYYIMFVVTLATLIYGVTSWIVLKKFRNYKNYVCLNAIVANFFVSLLMQITNYIKEDISLSLIDTCWFAIITLYLLMYLATAKHHWLIVICHMFYVDIVKVFNVHIRWKYLKSALFGWGVPVILTIIQVIVTSGIFFVCDINPSDVGFIIFITTVTMNCLLYFRIVYSLCRSSNSSAYTAMNKWRRFYIATVIFVLGDILLLSFHVISFVDHMQTKEQEREYTEYTLFFQGERISRSKKVNSNNKLVDFLQIIIYNLNPLLLNVYLVVVRSNRELWYEFYVNHVNLRLLPARNMDHDINMQELTRDQPAAPDVLKQI